MQTKSKHVPISRDSGCPSRIMFIEYCGVPKHGDGRKNCIQWRFRYAYCRVIRFTKGTISRCESKGFCSVSDLWEYIRNKVEPNHKQWIFCNQLLNLARLDSFIEQIYSSGYNNDRITISDPPVILDIANGSRKIIFVDYRNYFRKPFSISPDGADDYLFWSVVCSNNMDAIHGICKERCELLSRNILDLIKFHRDNNFGSWKPTISGLAWQAYRKRFNRTKIYPTIDKKIKEIERSSYFGGTCICHKRGVHEEQLYKLDVNSLYPYIYSTSELPTSLDEVIDCEWQECKDTTIDWTKCIAQVEIKHNERFYPYRGREDYSRKDSRYRTVLCGRELDKANSIGDISSFGCIIKYNTSCILKEFGNYLYGKRLASNEEHGINSRDFIKSYLNSIYGKWAQRIPTWIDRPEIRAVEPWAQWKFIDATNGKEVTLRSIAGFVQEESDSSDFEYTFVAIPAFITANARVYMDNIANVAGRENIYYEDTDSIITNVTGYDRLLLRNLCHQRNFGKLKLEKEIRSASLYGIRDYDLDGRITVSGIKTTANRFDNRFIIQTETGSEQRQGVESRLNGLYSLLKLIKLSSRETDLPKFKLYEQSEIAFDD